MGQLQIFRRLLAILAACVLLAACNGGSLSGPTGASGGDTSGNAGGNTGGNTGGSSGGGSGSGTSGNTGTGKGRIFVIQPDASATADMVNAMIQAAPGDVIQFECGFFDLTSTLQLINTEDVVIRGCGKDRTVLSFKNNDAPEGILAVNVHGVFIQDLTVLDTGGNGIELRGVDHGTLQKVRTMWSSGGGRQSADPITADNFYSRVHVPCTDPATQDPNNPENMGGDTSSPDYTVSKLSGRYGIYPVSSSNILIEDSESIGASDAGIYVGQTNNAIFRRNRAAYNVFGFEIENVQHGEYDSNLAECNTGGFLIYDLDGLRQYGDRSVMHDNVSRMNNTYNFTEGGFVGNVPPGSGMITLSYDRIDVYNNRFEHNNTAGIIHTSYEIFPEGAGRPTEHRIDWYTEGLHIFGNTFLDNGNHLPLPSTSDLQSQELSHFLPALVGAKNLAACLDPANAAACLAAGGNTFRGAHILWDGLLDTYHSDCPYPTEDGTPGGTKVPSDERGKPILGNDVADPSCHYNAYKFDTAKTDAPRILPDWFSCIDADNDFSGDSLAYANFHGTKGLEAVIAAASADPTAPDTALPLLIAGLSATDIANLGSSFDRSPHDCVAQYGKNLPRLAEVVIPPFERSGDYDPAPTDAEVAELCDATVGDGAVNWAAATVNCPTLNQYHLFSDPTDPTSAPNGGGVPFVLNTKLFSDYAVKFRVMYIPEGKHAVYADHASGGVNATIQFPVGTIIAKTFSFDDESTDKETPIETRLLIKRVNSKGQVRWDGLPYAWGVDPDTGKPVATLAMAGGTRSVSWNQHDVDSGQLQVGSTPGYSIPNANQCISCHANEDADTGAAPIGPKIRNLNRAYRPESGLSFAGSLDYVTSGRNQVEYLCSEGLMTGCPADLGVNPTTQVAENLERLPTFNKPGDAGFAAGSDADVEARARAYMEVNCGHCHNARGFASNTGFYLDAAAPLTLNNYGICKKPTATGQEGNGGRTYDINPGNAGDSIVDFRTGPDATTPAARMPPIARSVVHDEGHQLMNQWIQNVLTGGCSG